MKLQKLMYFTHGYYLAVTENPWLDELFEAWEFGPVLPSVYYELKTFGAKEIRKGWRVKDAQQQRFSAEIPEPSDDDTGARILSFVMDRYGSKSSIYLSDLTHKIGSPWHTIKMQNGGKIPRNTDIPNELIRKYFLTLIGINN